MQYTYLLIFASIVHFSSGQTPSVRPTCTDANVKCSAQGPTQDCGNRGLTEIPCRFPCKTQILNLTQNSFTRLYQNVFNGECSQTALRVLDLSQSSISVAEEGFFGLLVSLQKLFLSRNNLERFLPGSFDSNIELQEVHLDDNQLVDVPRPLRTSKRLRRLYLQGNMIRGLAVNQFSQLTDLEYLDLSNNRIESMSELSFENLTQLQVLILSSNPFSNIPGEAFSKLTSLNTLTITDHMLENVRYSWLKLPSLTELNLEYGILSDIANNAFKYLAKLVTLSLGGNKLTDLRRSMFIGLDRIQYLDLSGNKLSILSSDFADLGTLESLDLSHNQLTQISQDMFEGIEALHHLYLADNLLHDVGDALGVLPLLHTVDITSNRIANLSSDAFVGNSKLKQIQMNENWLKDVPAAILEANDMLRGSLESLGLKGNLISVVHSDSFGHLTHLTDLDLTHNALHKVEPNSFINLPELANLRLSGNLLTTMHKASLDSNRKLTNVYLHDNPWMCDCDVLGLWNHLNASQVNVMSSSDVICQIPGKLDKRSLTDISADKSYNCKGSLLTQTDIMIISIAAAVGLIIIILAIVCGVVIYKKKGKRNGVEPDGAMQNSVQDDGLYLTPSLNSSQTNMSRAESHKYDEPFIAPNYLPMHVGSPGTPKKPKLAKSNHNDSTDDGYIEPMEVPLKPKMYKPNHRLPSDDGYIQPMQLPGYTKK